MKKYFFETKKTARYFTLGNTKNVKKLWIVLHGYAQTADNFLESFSDLQDETTLIVAPEGLAHFYWKDFVSNPVASWMTRLERENDISDINNYLNKLLEKLASQIPLENVQINVLGFSQSAPVLMRWLQTINYNIDNIFLLAGKPAHDIDWQNQENYFRGKTIHFLHGDDDKFVRTPDIQIFKELFKKENVDFIVYSFKGKHEVNSECIQLLQKITNSI